MNKETLDDILRVGRRVATTSNECIKRWPVCFSKSGECFPRSFIRLGLACLQNDGPMRRLERRASFLQRPWNRFREQLLSPGWRLGDEKSSDDNVTSFVGIAILRTVNCEPGGAAGSPRSFKLLNSDVESGAGKNRGETGVYGARTRNLRRDRAAL